MSLFIGMRLISIQLKIPRPIINIINRNASRREGHSGHCGGVPQFYTGRFFLKRNPRIRGRRAVSRPASGRPSRIPPRGAPKPRKKMARAGGGGGTARRRRSGGRRGARGVPEQEIKKKNY